MGINEKDFYEFTEECLDKNSELTINPEDLPKHKDNATGRTYVSSYDVYRKIGLPVPVWKQEYRWYLDDEPESDYTIEEMEECNKCFEEKFEYLLEDPATGSLLDIYSHLMCVAGANDIGIIGSEHDSIAGNLTVAKFKLSQRIADEIYMILEE